MNRESWCLLSFSFGGVGLDDSLQLIEEAIETKHAFNTYDAIIEAVSHD